MLTFGYLKKNYNNLISLQYIYSSGSISSRIYSSIVSSSFYSMQYIYNSSIRSTIYSIQYDYFQQYNQQQYLQYVVRLLPAVLLVVVFLSTQQSSSGTRATERPQRISSPCCLLSPRGCLGSVRQTDRQRQTERETDRQTGSEKQQSGWWTIYCRQSTSEINGERQIKIN